MNTKKIEMKDICGYIPYGLKIKCSDTGEVMELSGTSGKCTLELIMNSEPEMARLVAIDKSEDIEEYGIPLLRPLSDLIRAITINGKTFIPIIELNRMRGVTVAASEYDEVFSEPACYGCKWGGFRSFSFDSETISFYDNSKVGLSPQYDMFQKLYEWHFDLNNLIPAGLAESII